MMIILRLRSRPGWVALKGEKTTPNPGARCLLDMYHTAKCFFQRFHSMVVNLLLTSPSFALLALSFLVTYVRFLLLCSFY